MATEVERPKEVAFYDYTDHAGNVIYQKVRTEPKGFYHRRKGPGGKGYAYSLSPGWYAWAGNRWVHTGGKQDDGQFNCDPSLPLAKGDVYWMEQVRKVPFQWTEIRKRPDHPVLVVEGEKLAQRLGELGFISVCSPDGAGKWPLEFGGYLSGRDVVVFPDNDEVGMQHAAQVIGSAVLFKAKSFRIVEPKAGVYMPPEAGDLYDYLEQVVVNVPSLIRQHTVQRDAVIGLVKTFPKMSWEPEQKK